MASPSVVSSVVLLAAGAAIGFVPTYLNERRKERHALRTRWDIHLFQVCGEFAGVAREFLHRAERLNRSVDKDAQKAKIDEQHAMLRALSERIRLVGNEAVQSKARLVVHHAYAVRATAEGQPDVRAKDYPNTTPRERFLDALRGFYVAARRQLRVSEPDEIAPDKVLLDEPWDRSGMSEKNNDETAD